MKAIPKIEKDQRYIFYLPAVNYVIEKTKDGIQWEEVLRKIRRGKIKKVQKELKAEQQEYVKKFVGSIDRLADLVELESKLKSL
jgi:hypothetical protein